MIIRPSWISDFVVIVELKDRIGTRMKGVKEGKSVMCVCCRGSVASCAKQLGKEKRNWILKAVRLKLSAGRG